MRFLKNKQIIWLIIGILILSIFLRFYKLADIFVFSLDEEYQITLAKTIVDNFHIIWIGVSASNLGFYLGPFWTYFTSFWLLISKNDPQITAYIASFIGVITTGVIIFAGYRMFNPFVGILAGLLYATLPLLVYFDQKYWNPTLTPILSLLMLISIYFSKKSPYYWVLFSLCFGLVFHVHLSLLPYGLVALIWLIKEKTINKRVFILSLLTFLLIISPLIAFDYFHKLSNVTTPLRFKEITQTEAYKINPVHHSVALFEYFGRILYLKPNQNNADEVFASCTSTSIYKSDPILDKYSTRTKPVIFLSLLSLTALLYFVLRKITWQRENYRLLALSSIAILIGFLFFPAGAPEYYLSGFSPLFLLILGITIDWQKKRIKTILLAFLIVLCVLGIITVISVKDDFGIKNKKLLVEEVMIVVGDKPYKLVEEGLCHRNAGWRYLFSVYGKKPERSSTDGYLGWLYPLEISDKQLDYRIVINETRTPINFDSQYYKSISKAGFTAYIFRY